VKAGRLWPVSLLRWGGRQAVSSPGDRGRLPSPRFCRLGPVVLRGHAGARWVKPSCRFLPTLGAGSSRGCGRVVKVAATSVRVVTTRDGKWPRFPCDRNRAGIPEWGQVTPESAQANCHGGQGLAERRSLLACTESACPVVASGSWLTLSAVDTGAPTGACLVGRPLSLTKSNAAPLVISYQEIGAAWLSGAGARCIR
jgi:hypothetical protein